MKEKTIGILGGMGPEATLDLYRRILLHTPARNDQEHLHVIIDSNSKIPSRNEAVLHGGADPTPMQCASARTLEKAGVDFIIMPCNSAHIFLPALRQSVSIPFLSIVDATIEALLQQAPHTKCVGLLSTPAVAARRVYADPLQALGIETLVPDAAGQEEVYGVISSVKAGNKSAQVSARLKAQADILIALGAQAIFLACTELPLVLGQADLEVPVLDTLETLAVAAVRHARE